MGSLLCSLQIKWGARRFGLDEDRIYLPGLPDKPRLLGLVQSNFLNPGFRES